MKDKLLFMLYVAIGGFGAIGQAMLLRNDLVNSYPYKMMDLPPYQFYAHIGEVGSIISPAIAITLVFLFMSVKRYWIPAVPVVACPLIFWMVFEYFSWASPYHGAVMNQPQFERYTGEIARQIFIRASLILSGIGLVIGFACGVIVSLAENVLNKFGKETI
jgi:hypothetical protein